MIKRMVACMSMAAVLAFAVGAEEIVMDGSTTVGPIAKAFAEYYMKSDESVKITVSESGSGNGAKALMNGTCHIANLSRFMKDTEWAGCAEKKVMPVAHCVALDGLAVVVHPSNPVKGLTVEQVRDIYLGKTKNWKDIGGPNKKIVVISRDTNSGTYESFEEKVMNKEKMAEGVEYVGSSGAIRQKIQSTDAAIGYVGLGFADETVKSLEIDGIVPSVETVQSGVYPIARPLFMFTNAYPQMGTTLYKLVTLHLTAKGQDIIEEIGFVPVTAYTK